MKEMQVSRLANCHGDLKQMSQIRTGHGYLALLEKADPIWRGPRSREQSDDLTHHGSNVWGSYKYPEEPYGLFPEFGRDGKIQVYSNLDQDENSR